MNFFGVIFIFVYETNFRYLIKNVSLKCLKPFDRQCMKNNHEKYI